MFDTQRTTRKKTDVCNVC